MNNFEKMEQILLAEKVENKLIENGIDPDILYQVAARLNTIKGKHQITEAWDILGYLAVGGVGALLGWLTKANMKSDPKVRKQMQRLQTVESAIIALAQESGVSLTKQDVANAVKDIADLLVKAKQNNSATQTTTPVPSSSSATTTPVPSSSTTTTPVPVPIPTP